jgi:hypothetical protein
MLIIALPGNGPLTRSLTLALFWDERKRPLATPEEPEMDIRADRE